MERMADLDLHDVGRYVGAELVDRNGGTDRWDRRGVPERGHRASGVAPGVGGPHGAPLHAGARGSAGGRQRRPGLGHEKAFVQAAPVYPEQYGTLPPADEARLFSYYRLPRDHFGG